MVDKAAGLRIKEISTIIPFPELDFAGPLPQGNQRYTVLTLAASPMADGAAVRTFIKAIASPENAALLRAVGLELPP